ncbi:hypothetical protein ACNKHX_13960 [Shigella flexneri]
MSLMALPNGAIARETVLRKILVRTKQSARRSFADKPDSAGRSANLASRSEFRYGRLRKRRRRNPINHAGLIFRVSLAIQSKTLLSSLMTR